jgi:enoyl-CoA hydratase/carnithine racemase
VSWILPRIVGHATALDLLLSGRVVLGSEAAALGLVHRAVPPDDLLPSAHAYALDMAANCSPLAMATAKRQVYLDWERSLLDARREARRLVGALKERSHDFSEGVRSFVEKRPPRFDPLSQPVDYSDFDRQARP